MPWREVCRMNEKMRFTAAVLGEEQSMPTDYEALRTFGDEVVDFSGFPAVT